jgi:hypothetical protein
VYCDSKGQSVCIVTEMAKCLHFDSKGTKLSQYKHFAIYCHNAQKLSFTIIIQTPCHLLSQYKHFTIYCHNIQKLSFTITIQTLAKCLYFDSKGTKYLYCDSKWQSVCIVTVIGKVFVL